MLRQGDAPEPNGHENTWWACTSGFIVLAGLMAYSKLVTENLNLPHPTFHQGLK